MRVLVIATSLSLVAVPVVAQNLQCGPREHMLDMIAAQDQTRRGIGLSGQAVMEIFAAPDGSRWTITATLPDGRMCLLAHGVAFEERDEAFPAQGQPL